MYFIVSYFILQLRRDGTRRKSRTRESNPWRWQDGNIGSAPLGLENVAALLCNSAAAGPLPPASRETKAVHFQEMSSYF